MIIRKRRTFVACESDGTEFQIPLLKTGNLRGNGLKSASFWMIYFTKSQHITNHFSLSDELLFIWTSSGRNSISQIRWKRVICLALFEKS